MSPSRDDAAQTIADLERENHRLRVELETARRRAAAWQRVAQWIHQAHQPDPEETPVTSYARADTRTQWFADHYPGARIAPNVVVLHTTEGTDWPSYSGGATAPNATARPVVRAKRLAWRQHFPDEMSARALRNESGGVETNTLNALQVELVGTCNPTHRHRWGSLVAGVDYIYWPEAPAWVLDQLGDFLADLHKRHGIRLQAPEFLAYPASYGDSRVRFTFAQWRNFYGICGHQHVPENSHGDPGNLDIGRVLARAQGLVAPKPKTRPARIAHAIQDLRAELRDTDQAKRTVITRRMKAALTHLTKVKPR